MAGVTFVLGSLLGAGRQEGVRSSMSEARMHGEGLSVRDPGWKAEAKALVLRWESEQQKKMRYFLVCGQEAMPPGSQAVHWYHFT